MRAFTIHVEGPITDAGGLTMISLLVVTSVLHRKRRSGGHGSPTAGDGKRKPR
jgi:hypothetical protein